MGRTVPNGLTAPFILLLFLLLPGLIHWASLGKLYRFDPPLPLSLLPLRHPVAKLKCDGAVPPRLGER